MNKVRSTFKISIPYCGTMFVLSNRFNRSWTVKVTYFDWLKWIFNTYTCSFAFYIPLANCEIYITKSIDRVFVQHVDICITHNLAIFIIEFLFIAVDSVNIKNRWYFAPDRWGKSANFRSLTRQTTRENQCGAKLRSISKHDHWILTQIRKKFQ